MLRIDILVRTFEKLHIEMPTYRRQSQVKLCIGKAQDEIPALVNICAPISKRAS